MNTPALHNLTLWLKRLGIKPTDTELDAMSDIAFKTISTIAVPLFLCIHYVIKRDYTVIPDRLGVVLAAYASSHVYQHCYLSGEVSEQHLPSIRFKMDETLRRIIDATGLEEFSKPVTDEEYQAVQQYLPWANAVAEFAILKRSEAKVSQGSRSVTNEDAVRLAVEAKRQVPSQFPTM